MTKSELSPTTCITSLDLLPSVYSISFFFSLCVSDTLSLIYCIKWCKQIMQTLWQNGWICLIIWYIHVIQTLKDDGRYSRKCPVV